MKHPINRKRFGISRITFLITAVLICILLSLNNAIAQDVAQYGTPFTGVPDRRDVTMYQVNTRAFSSTHNFAGVTARLDSIKALGVNVIYLMPIYPVTPPGVDNSSNSPYCIANFDSVGTEFGTLSDLRALVDGAHSRNMAIILDFVVNQTGFSHPWITQHKTWYVLDGSGNITNFSGYPDVAALNLTNDSVRRSLTQSMRNWIFRANFDGFRCDAANSPSVVFWDSVITNLRSISTHNLIMMAEGDRSANYGAGFDYNFGFDYYGDLKNIYGSSAAVTNIDNANTSDYVGTSGTNQIIRYLTNHDVNSSDGTPLQLFGGHAGSMSAFVATAYMKGVPFIYNGQEVDFATQITYPFTSVTINWASSYSAEAEYKKIVAFRNSSLAIRQGSLTSYDNNDVAAFKKTSGTSNVFVMCNMRNSNITFTLPTGVASTTWYDAYTGAAISFGTTYTLSAYQYVVATNTGVNVPVTGVTVSPTTASITAGNTQQLAATIAPSNATNQSVTWSSSNTAIATVNSSGLITAIATGTATITATTTDGNKTATCAVTVTAPIAVTGVTVSPTSATLASGGTQQLTATVTPSNATNQNVTWSSSNTAVATVSSTGLVTAVGGGTATITVTTVSGSKTATSAITVTVPAGFTVYFYRPSTWGTAIKIYWWSALPAGALADGTWPGVAMTSNGNNWYSYTFTGITSTNLIFNDGSNQTANLSSSSNGWYENSTWYYSAPTAVTGVSVSPTSASIAVNGTQQLTATIAPSNAVNQNISWTSSNTAVATVSSTGLVTGVAAGTATITVTTQDGSKTATSAITVTGGSTTYYNIQNRWQPTEYLYDGGTGVVLYGTSPGTNHAYQWSEVSVAGGYVQLQNRGTGNYMYVEDQTGSVECGSIQQTWYSAMWSLASAATGYYYIENRWQTSEWIHVEDQNGHAEYSGAQSGWYSAMWQFVNGTTMGDRQLINQGSGTIPANVVTEVKIFPNPVRGNQFNVLLPDMEDNETAQVLVTDASGRVLLQTTLTGSGPVAHQLAPGMYLINIRTSKINVTQKLVVL